MDSPFNPAVRIAVGQPVADGISILPPVETADGTLAIRFRVGGQALHLRLGIYDVRGRCLRRLDLGVRAPGEHLVSWDRRDAAGRRCARGIVLVRRESPDAGRTRRAVLLHD